MIRKYPYTTDAKHQHNWLPCKITIYSDTDRAKKEGCPVTMQPSAVVNKKIGYTVQSGKHKNYLGLRG